MIQVAFNEQAALSLSLSLWSFHIYLSIYLSISIDRYFSLSLLTYLSILQFVFIPDFVNIHLYMMMSVMKILMFTLGSSLHENFAASLHKKWFDCINCRFVMILLPLLIDSSWSSCTSIYLSWIRALTLKKFDFGCWQYCSHWNLDPKWWCNIHKMSAERSSEIGGPWNRPREVEVSKSVTLLFLQRN